MIAVLVNPNNVNTQRNVADLQGAAHTEGVLLHILEARTEKEIDAGIQKLKTRQIKFDLGTPEHNRIQQSINALEDARKEERAQEDRQIARSHLQHAIANGVQWLDRPAADNHHAPDSKCEG